MFIIETLSIYIPNILNEYWDTIYTNEYPCQFRYCFDYQTVSFNLFKVDFEKFKGTLKKITALKRYKRCRWSSLQRTFFYYHYHHVLFLQISFSLLYLRNILDSPECTAYSCEICFTFTQHVYMYGLHTNIVPQATIWSFYIWCTNVSKCRVLPLSQTVVCPNNSFLSPTLNGHVPLRWVWNSWHIAIKINMNKTH